MNPDWAPSRFRYSAFKLIGYVVAQRSSSHAEPRLLNFHPDQNAVGTMAVALFFFGTAMIYVLAWIIEMGSKHGLLLGCAALALLVSAPLLALVVVVVVFPITNRIAGRFGSHEDSGLQFLSAVGILLGSAVAVVTLLLRLPGIVAAVVWSTGVSVNLVASILIRTILRRRIEQLDRSLKEIARFDV